MPLFRRKPDAAPGPPPTRTPGRAARPEDDWRSYDRFAEPYASSMEPVTRPADAKAVELLQLPAGAKVLDLGTGTGVAAREAAGATAGGRLVVGVDPSLPMVHVAARAGGGPVYASATSIDLPFRDGTFDAVLVCFVMAHFTDYRTALAETLRVLRSGGRMAVTTWASSEDVDEFKRAWREVAEGFAEHEMLADAQDRAVPWEERFSDPERLKDALHEAGLRDIWIERSDYRVEQSAEDYLAGRETSASGRFLEEMLGQEYWETFRTAVRAAFAERFPARFNDFHQVLVAVGHKL
jgi:ubiquinone/menaquinone biosynthesis C-methylase UbiE